MTFGIAIQGLVGALAGLLFVESRLRRNQHIRGGCGGDATAPIEFHPELIVRWDDEASYARRPACTRKLTADHAVAIRPQLTMPRSNTHIR